MYTIFRTALPIMLLAITGCTSMRGYPPELYNLKKEADQLIEAYYTKDVIKIYNNPYMSASEKRPYRDAVVNGRIRVIDIQFILFEQSLAGERVKTDVGADVTTLALTGTAAAMPGFTVAQTVLPAIAAFVTGSKAAFDKRVYYEKTIQVLFAKMESLRKQALVKIRRGLILPDDEYTLYEALVDVDDYYRAGSIPAALIGIAEESGASADVADKELKEIATYSYGPDENSTKLRDYWQPGGFVNQVNEGKLYECINEYFKKGDKPTIFELLNAGKFKDARRKFVEKLGL